MRFLVALLAAAALVTAGCGTDEPARVNANTDATALLRSTFENLANLESAHLDLQAGAGDESLRLSGPFAAAKEKGELPRFAFAVAAKSPAGTTTAGLTWTVERGYATLDGTPYELPSLLVQQLGAGIEQGSPLPALDASKWITNPRNAGPATVAGVETVKLTGGVDIRAALADFERLGQSLGSGLSLLGGSRLQLSAADRARAATAVRDATVEVYTGAADSMLRRLLVRATIDGEPVVADLTLTRVGEDVAIAQPKGARPFSELLQKLQAAGGLPIK